MNGGMFAIGVICCLQLQRNCNHGFSNQIYAVRAFPAPTRRNPTEGHRSPAPLMKSAPPAPSANAARPLMLSWQNTAGAS
jgi:hypothetical protein